VKNELPPDNLKNLWQGQNVEPIQMSLEELRRKAQKFQNTIRNRNLREYIAAAIVLPAFSWLLWRFPALRVGCILILAGTLYVMYHLHTKGSAKVVPEDLALDTCLAFHKRELERQRDLVRDVWKWYLLPFAPGLIAMVAEPLLRLPPVGWVRAWPFILVCAAMFYLVWQLNKQAADKLQRQIDELELQSGLRE
jgi:Flp pilus assembly protein TadB